MTKEEAISLILEGHPNQPKQFISAEVAKALLLCGAFSTTEVITAAKLNRLCESLKEP